MNATQNTRKQINMVVRTIILTQYPISLHNTAKLPRGIMFLYSPQNKDINMLCGGTPFSPLPLKTRSSTIAQGGGDFYKLTLHDPTTTITQETSSTHTNFNKNVFYYMLISFSCFLSSVPKKRLSPSGITKHTTNQLNPAYIRDR